MKQIVQSIQIQQTDRIQCTRCRNIHGESGSVRIRISAQTVTITADGSTVANFTLEEIAQGTISGKVTDQSTGDPIEGATLLLEDANISPVQSDASGQFAITAYEGEYTMKVVANGYHSQEANISIGGQTHLFRLDPFFTYPGGEIGYDDGTAENARCIL